MPRPNLHDSEGDEGPGTAFRMVDAHHHLWDLEAHSYDWLMGDGWPEKTAALGDYTAVRRTYSVDDYIAEVGPLGVVKSVHLQADWTGSEPVDETVWLQEAADRTGLPSAIVAWADLREPDIQGTLERHLEAPNLRGIRIVPDAGMLEEAAFIKGLSLLGRLGLSFDLAVTPDLVSRAANAIRSVPGTAVILEHTGLPMFRDAEYFHTWAKGLRLLAQFPQVSVKISGLGTVDHAWTIDTLRPWVTEAIEAFGVERSMFASNWPVDRLYSSYADLIDAYRVITQAATPEERAGLFAKNAERIYRI